MTILNNVMYFRGETVTLYATFKLPTGQSAADLLVSFSPAITIEYANNMDQIVEIVSGASMVKMTSDRYYYNWTIPANAPLTTYNAVMSGTIDGKVIVGTQEVVVGNPAATVQQDALRYGANSFIQESRTYEPRIHPQLPQGTF